MGEQVEHRTFTGEDRTRYREKLHRCMDAFRLMLREGRFEGDRPLTGLEIELNLVDEHGDPTMRNAQVLAAIADPAFQTELGRFNIEVNIPPRALTGHGLAEVERVVAASLLAAEERGRRVGAHSVMIGILPTVRPDHLGLDALTANPRYALLNDQVLTSRGENLSIRIDGADRLVATAETILPEAACTSTQLHLQVGPERFPAYWNAAQAIAGPQLAVGANSPLLFGRRLWAETRIPLFEQATDTRPEEIKTQGVRPRVWFGERWITSVLDLFEENARYFPALLPIVDDEDPAQVLREGRAPGLAELRLLNGTIYRWNRPVYDVAGGSAHLRVENRVLPAGPTAVDTAANAAFYFGLVRALAESQRPVWSRMPFAMAEANFHAGARDGIDAMLFWPGYGRLPATDLVPRVLLPLAHEGLRRWGVLTDDRERLLGIIEDRCATGRTGATWQVEALRAASAGGPGRLAALREVVLRYRRHMRTGDPVHRWPLD